MLSLINVLFIFSPLAFDKGLHDKSLLSYKQVFF